MTNATENLESPSAPANGIPTTPAVNSAPSDGAEKIADVVARLKLPAEPPERLPTNSNDDERRRRVMFTEFFRSVGRRYRDCTLDNYQVNFPKQAEVIKALRTYSANMAAEVEAGAGVVLFGGAGSGKDHMLVGLARLAIVKHGISVIWRNGVVLFSQIRDQIGRDLSEGEIVRDLIRPPILILSDPTPPTGTLTDFQAATLMRVIDGRYRECRPTWVSLNVASRQEADTRLTAPIVDRLRDGAVTCFCSWSSYRQSRNVGQTKGETLK